MRRSKIVLTLALILLLASCDTNSAEDNPVDDVMVSPDQSVSPLPAENNPKPFNTIVYKNFTLIDGNGGEPIENAFIIVEGSRITEVSADYTESGENVVDLQGLTVLPGLINVHVHNAYNEAQLQNWLNGGVTTVREMSVWTNDALGKRDRMNQDPKNAFIVSASPMMAPQNGYGSFFYDTPEDAAESAKLFAEQGYNFIKLSIEDNQGGTFPLPTYEHIKSIVDAAHESGLKASVHVIHEKHMQWAIDSGADDIAHSVCDGRYTEEDIARMVENNTYINSTLELYTNYGDHTVNTAKANLGAFYAAGGKVAMGTDFDGAGPNGVFEKGSPVKELKLMGEAGMSNMDIIIAATKNAAYVCDLADEIGTIEVGKKADFIVVAGDPLTDISAVQNIKTVVHAGIEVYNIPDKGTVETLNISAPSLANNIIGEPLEQGVSVYLPPSYPVSNKSYPVLYWLPGFGDNFNQQLRSMATGMDNLLKNGSVNEMIIVSVNGNNILGGSFYHNSPVTGNWEDFVVKDVVSYIDSNYRTIQKFESRGIAGHSMGGYGVIGIAMHRDIFGSVYSMSPGVFNEEGFEESPMNFNAVAFEIEDLASLDDAEAHDSYIIYAKSLSWPRDFPFAYGSAFAPDTNGRAPYILLPEKTEEGFNNDEVYAMYEAGYGGIPEELDQYGDNLRMLNGFVFEAGTNDEFSWIPDGCAYLSDQLTQRGIPHEYREFLGEHQNLLFNRINHQVIPFFSEMFGIL